MKRQRKTSPSGVNQELYSIWKRLKITAIFILFISLFFVPKNGFGATGEEVYNKLCMACHSLSNKVLLGPGLHGMSERRSEEWLISWIRDSQGLIESGDEEAIKIFEEYHNVPMPGFPQLSDDEIRALIAYVDEQSVETATATSGGGATASASNAGSDSGEADSGSNQLFFWIVVALIVFIFLLYRYKRKAFETLNQSGFHSEPHSIPNYFAV